MENNTGFIKLYRSLKDNPIWKNSSPEQCKILITLLLMANHKENEWEWQGQKFKTKPGQFITSLDNIVKECGKGISIQNVRSALKRFEKLEFLTDKSTKTGRLITIINWDIYQSLNNSTNKVDNNEVTKYQQRGNKEVTPNKNDKNDKNDKKYIYSPNSNEFRLASYLFNFIKRNNPKAKEPDLQKWSKQIDYILRIDKREIEEVKSVIKWCQNDDFWFKNILSPEKLRKHYDQLVLQMGGKKVQNGNDGESNKKNYDWYKTPERQYETYTKEQLEAAGIK